MRVLSLFSGAGGFDIGLEQAGMKTVFQCEKDKFCQGVLRRHWSDVPKWDDITTLTGAHILEVTGGIDVVAWGSPCQNLSRAGNGLGLEGDESKLFFEGIRIINELRQVSNGQFPRWSIWENVAGALFSNRGSDFGQVLKSLADAGACFSEWAVLDAQYFGVPQHRRRVFVASCFDSRVSSKCPEPLFPVAISVIGDSKKRNRERLGLTREPKEISDGYSQLGFRLRGFGYYIEDGSFSTITTRESKQTTTDLVISPMADVKQFRAKDGKIWLGADVSPLWDLFGEKELINANYVLKDVDFVVRTLTPIEYERMMGWEEHHTEFMDNGKKVSEVQRIKMCANGVVSYVAKWVGEVIGKAENTNA